MLAGGHVPSSQNLMAVLNCRRLPARLNVTEVAILLGFRGHDIAPLIAAKLLTPLGKPAPNAPKYFAAVEIVERAENPAWLSDATRALARYWHAKNGQKRNCRTAGSNGRPH
jgi:hypothetical protein